MCDLGCCTAQRAVQWSLLINVCDLGCCTAQRAVQWSLLINVCDLGCCTAQRAVQWSLLINVCDLGVCCVGGFKLSRPTAPFSTPNPMATVNDFVPPVLNMSSQTSSSGRTTTLLFYGVPTMPGGF